MMVYKVFVINRDIDGEKRFYIYIYEILFENLKG